MTTTETEASPTFLRDLFGWYSMILLGLGRSTGLLDTILAAPGTTEEIAARAGVDRRNTHEWLRGITAAAHASHRDGVYTIDPTTAFMFGPDFPVDARAVVDFTVAAPALHQTVVDAMRAGNGVPSEMLESLSEAAGGVNGPTYAAALVSEWIEGVPGLSDRLRAGGSAADLAAGNGDAAALVGSAFPQATVVGYDLVSTSRSDLPANVSLRLADARALPDDGPFDLIYCLDSFHHLGEPAAVLAQARKMLGPDGVLMIVESDLTGDIDTDAQNPFAVVVYACGLLYCLQESLAGGSTGHSNADGPGWVLSAMSDAGFGDLDVRPSETGYNVITGRL